MLLAVLCAAAAAGLAVAPRVTLPRAMPSVETRGLRRPRSSVLAACSAAVLVLVLAPSPVAVVAAPVAAVVAARVTGRLEPAAVRRRRSALESGLPQVVDLMGVCLAAGRSPDGALRLVADVVGEPMRGELATYVRRLELGADPLTVWRSVALHPQLGPLGRALHRCAETGASVAAALTRLGDDLHARRRAATEARARTIEVRASLPLGLCLLPAFVLIGIVPMIASSVSLTLLAP
ncbi:MAG TPA: type II secretion system F family protein [Nocardioidaceae bacterium]|nr:type II secretion system F family protein [Nocardioidaceae bacterium]